MASAHHCHAVTYVLGNLDIILLPYDKKSQQVCNRWVSGACVDNLFFLFFFSHLPSAAFLMRYPPYDNVTEQKSKRERACKVKDWEVHQSVILRVNLHLKEKQFKISDSNKIPQREENILDTVGQKSI